MNLQITSVHFDADQKLLTYIEKKAGKLSQFFDRIIDCSVFLKLENSGQVKDKIVEIRANIPGETLIASQTSKTFEAATDQAVDNMKRQLVRAKEKMRLKQA